MYCKIQLSLRKQQKSKSTRAWLQTNSGFCCVLLPYQEKDFELQSPVTSDILTKEKLVESPRGGGNKQPKT